MKRQPTHKLLSDYANTWANGSFVHSSYDQQEEQTHADQFSKFTNENENCFDRHSLPGHFTGSAMVIDRTLSKVLLTLHGKLNIWLQLGGHAEGDHILSEVALKEANEESGLEHLHFLEYENATLAKDGLIKNAPPLPFDIDCHLIPARKADPEHYHYDVRFLIVADHIDKIKISHESHDLQWFSLDEARKVTSERSMVRQFDKLEYLKNLLL